ncbi:trypsin-1-like [Daphnia carinata]|uniref:trypsin-1-like n=1 Tax=Daphnia carinata TaxID=120202 RepID=UPI0025802E37|nr:trypsin-1-like [Daphnia carinata]
MASVILFFVVIVLSSFHPAKGLTYQTRDAIIIEADDVIRINDPYQSATLASNTLGVKDGSCFTRSGHLGSCKSIRTCYPTTKWHQLNQLETWTIISRDTCVYSGEEGRQVYGVCCTTPFVNDGNDEDNKKISGSTLAVPVNPYTGQPNNGPSNYHLWFQNTSNNIKTTTTDSGNSVLDSKETVQCGAGPTKMLSYDEQRIVGGTAAEKNSWPSIVSLRLNGRFFCGGSLIAADKILTAAHCVDKVSSTEMKQLTVDLGMHKLNPSDAQETKSVGQITIHRGWDSNTNRNDIAILTLESPVTYSKDVSPICLPSVGLNDQFVNKDAAIIGWGTTKSGGTLPDVLQQATVKVLNNVKCKESYPRLFNSMLCASAPRTDSCQGDSGGPLLVRTSPDSPWTQTGIVSFGIGCALAKFPGVYTRVTSFRPWIKQYAGV